MAPIQNTWTKDLAEHDAADLLECEDMDELKEFEIEPNTYQKSGVSDLQDAGVETTITVRIERLKIKKD